MTPTTTATRKRTKVGVAIVDDHRMVGDALALRLAARGSRIEVLATATSWAELLAHPSFPFPVVVLDLNLEDHIPISAKIRVLDHAGSTTVVISRHVDSSSIYGAIQAGAAAFVAKTESAGELIETIHAAVRGRERLSPAVVRALDEFSGRDDPHLGRQEHRALVLYASGRSIRDVAAEMATTEETVKSYIKRARRKYRAVGVDLGTKVLLRRHALREGWIAPE